MIGRWTAIQDNQRFKGELAVESGCYLIDVETRTFDEVSKIAPNATKLFLRVMDDDGAGVICHYEKRGPVWVRTFRENILPNWFGCLMLIMTITIIGGGMLLLWLYDTVWSK